MKNIKKKRKRKLIKFIYGIMPVIIFVLQATYYIKMLFFT